MVKAIPTAKEFTAKTKDIESTAVEKFLSLKDLHFAQKADPDISYIMHLMEKKKIRKDRVGKHQQIKLTISEHYGRCGRG